MKNAYTPKKVCGVVNMPNHISLLPKSTREFSTA